MHAETRDCGQISEDPALVMTGRKAKADSIVRNSRKDALSFEF